MTCSSRPASRLADDVAHPSVTLERRVCREVAEVARSPRGGLDPLDDAEALIHRYEQRPILLLARAQRRLGAHRFGGLGGGAVEARDPARRVAQRRPGEGEVAHRPVGPPPRERRRPVDEVLRLARQHGLRERAVLVPDLREEVGVRRAETAWVLGAEDRDIAVVVERGERRPPGDVDRLPRGKEEFGRGPQGRRPGLNGSERRLSPVVRTDARAHLAPAGGPPCPRQPGHRRPLRVPPLAALHGAPLLGRAQAHPSTPATGGGRG